MCTWPAEVSQEFEQQSSERPFTVQKVKRQRNASFPFVPSSFPESSTASSPLPPPSPKKQILHRRSVSQEFLTPAPSIYLTLFEEKELVGVGHFGEVFKCQHRLDGRTYAIKRLKVEYQGCKHREYILKEVRELAKCDSPYIIRYFFAWEEFGKLYFQTEYCDYGNLLKYLGKKFEETELLRMIKHIARGLRHLHSKDLVHLDIKPENIYLKSTERRDGSLENLKYKYKIGDLGLVSPSSLENGFPSEGDARYLSKEILQENRALADLKKGDIFSLGASIYEMATRKGLPSNGSDYHALRNGMLQKPDPNVYTDQFWNLLGKMLHSDPNMRPTAEEILQMPLIIESKRGVNSMI